MALLNGRAQGLLQQRRVIPDLRQLDRLPSPFLHEGAQHGGVKLDDSPRPGLIPRLDQLVSRGNDGDPGPRLDRNHGVAGRQERAQIVRPQPVRARQEHLRGHHVLPHQAHVVPRRHRFQDLHALVIHLPHLLDHDHGIGPQGKRVAGVYIAETALDALPVGNALESLGGEFGRAEGIFGAHADSVHGRGVVMGRRDAGKDGLRGDAVQRVRNADRLMLELARIDPLQEQLARLF